MKAEKIRLLPGKNRSPFSEAELPDETQLMGSSKDIASDQLTSSPVQTRFGYHVIRLDDVRPVKFPTYEEVKPRIQQQITQRKVDQLVRSLRAKAKIE